MPPDEPPVIWHPDPGRVSASHIHRFREWLRSQSTVDATDYDELWAWSTHEVGSFWSAVAEYFHIPFHQPPRTALVDGGMPHTSWFPGATLNYAEQALGDDSRKSDQDLAVIFHREDGQTQRLTFHDLRKQVAATRAMLAAHGVKRGDRVAALLPNCPDAVVSFLATASLGAVWSSCSPDFGPRSITERFSQIDPVALITVDGYYYNGRAIDISSTVAALQEQLTTVQTTFLVPYMREDGSLVGTTGWYSCRDEFTDAALEFTPVPFDHPLWILYSSGTTGLPKAIVHGHGGIVLEHIKTLALQFDVHPTDRFFWFTTTGWMMWNFLVSGLLVGAPIVLYDGSPTYPNLDRLWQLAADEGVTIFGTSAPFIHACLKEELALDRSNVAAMRMVASTGAPLSADGFLWVADNFGPHVQIASFSGGTDVCTGFIGPSPDVPVWRGELSRPALGAAVAAFDSSGNAVVDEVGELVLTKPMPSMPVVLWNDTDGSRLRDAYFGVFPGVWRHGDWVTVTGRGSVVIHGRSDATINRGGIRMGTAEFYRVIESHPDVHDSLVIDTSGLEHRGEELLCFIVLSPGVELSKVEPELRQHLRSELSPRHVPDRFIVIDDVPRTLNGKKCEVPVKKILAGTNPAEAVSREALQNPSAIEQFVHL